MSPPMSLTLTAAGLCSVTAPPQTLRDASITQQKDIGVLSCWVEEMEEHWDTGGRLNSAPAPQLPTSTSTSAPHRPPEWHGPQQNGWDGERGSKAGKVERKRE